MIEEYHSLGPNISSHLSPESDSCLKCSCWLPQRGRRCLCAPSIDQLSSGSVRRLDGINRLHTQRIARRASNNLSVDINDSALSCSSDFSGLRAANTGAILIRRSGDAIPSMSCENGFVQGG